MCTFVDLTLAPSLTCLTIGYLNGLRASILKMLYHTMLSLGILFTLILLISFMLQPSGIWIPFCFTLILFTFGRSWHAILYPDPLLRQSPFPPFAHTIQSSLPHTLSELDLRSLVILLPPLGTTWM